MHASLTACTALLSVLCGRAECCARCWRHCRAELCDQPGYCNGRAASCTDGRCSCKTGFSGKRCQTEVEDLRTFTIGTEGPTYTLHVAPERSWDEAQHRCQRDGGHLVHLYSQAHASEVAKAVARLTDSWSVDFWVGLRANASDANRFVWVSSTSGEGVLGTDSSAFWARGQPDGGGEEPCVAVQCHPFILSNSGGCFHDFSCEEDGSFVCSPGELPESACVRAPCSTSGGPPVCTEAVGEPLGRSCACREDGHVYLSEQLGCMQPLEPRPITLVNGRAAWLYMTELSWLNADSVCRTASTTLVKVDSNATALALRDAVQGALGQDGWGDIWIGASRDDEGVFHWSDGSPLDYTRWAPNEPNNANGGEGCVESRLSTFWNDGYCLSQNRFVCVAQGS